AVNERARARRSRRALRGLSPAASGRGGPSPARPFAELRLMVRAAAQDGAVFEDDADGQSRHGDMNGVLDARQRLGLRDGTADRSRTQLPRAVVAPAVHRSIAPPRARARARGVELDDVLDPSDDRPCKARVASLSVAELSRLVAPPTSHGSVAHSRARV